MRSKAQCIIPARLESTRLPGKVLLDIGGKSMLQRVYERAIASELFEHVVIAAGCEKVFKAAKEFGAEATIVNGDMENGTQRVAVSVGFKQSTADVVVNLQADMPFIHKETLEAVLRPFDGGPFVESSTVAYQDYAPESPFDPSKVKVVVNELGNAMYFSRAPIPHGGAGCLYHMGVYAFRKEFMPQVLRLKPTKYEQAESLEQLRIIGHGYRMAVELSPVHETEVNTPRDIDEARRIAPLIDCGEKKVN